MPRSWEKESYYMACPESNFKFKSEIVKFQCLVAAIQKYYSIENCIWYKIEIRVITTRSLCNIDSTSSPTYPACTDKVNESFPHNPNLHRRNVGNQFPLIIVTRKKGLNQINKCFYFTITEEKRKKLNSAHTIK